MKRILFIIVAVMAIASCGQSQAEKEAIQARKNLLKTTVRSAQLEIDIANRSIREYNNNLKPGEYEMAEIRMHMDTTFWFKLIDEAKKKDLPDLEESIKEWTTQIKRTVR